jgi:hypothetical protein
VGVRLVTGPTRPLVAVLLLAAAIRLAGLQQESFTMDEVTELHLARGTVAEITRQADGFPPLYSLLLKGWIGLWRSADAARGLSALLGVLAVWAMYRIGMEAGGRPTALAAGLLLAVSPVHVWISQEARAYPLTFLLAALAVWRFTRALRTDARRDWLAYGAVAAAGLYAHYYLGLLALLHALWTLASVIRGRRPGPALAGHLVLGLLALPVLALLQADLAAQVRARVTPFSLGSVGYTLYAFVMGFSTGLSLRELHEAGLRAALAGFAPWLAALGLSAGLLLRPAVQVVRRRPAAAAYAAVIVLVPIALCGLLSETLSVKYKVNYVLWAAIPLLLLIAHVVVEGWGRPATRAAACLYLVLAAASLASRHLVDDYRNEDLRATAAHLARVTPAGTPVVVVPDYMADAVRYYLGPAWPVRALDARDERLAEVARPFRLVYTRPFDGDPDRRLRRDLEAAGDVRLEARFAGVDLWRADTLDHARAGARR